jgi:hypothetical protein
MSDPNDGWPDAARPGYPKDPELDGVHWLQFGDDRPIATAWVAELVAWASGAAYSPDGVVELGFRYIGPCLLPSEVAAQVEAARRDEREACAEAARCVPIPEDACAAEAHGRISAALEACVRIRARGDA